MRNMKRMKHLMSAIFSLCLLSTTLVAASVVNSVIKNSAGTLVGAAISNDTNRIEKLLNVMEPNAPSIELTLKALRQAQWYMKYQATTLLNNWLNNAENNGAVVVRSNERITPISMFGEKCICGYLGDHHKLHTYQRGMAATYEASIDNELAKRVKGNDYHDLRMFLSVVRISPGNVDAVSRAAQESIRIGHPESTIELNYWLDAAQSILANVMSGTDQGSFSGSPNFTGYPTGSQNIGSQYAAPNPVNSGNQPIYGGQSLGVTNVPTGLNQSAPQGTTGSVTNSDPTTGTTPSSSSQSSNLKVTAPTTNGSTATPTNLADGSASETEGEGTSNGSKCSGTQSPSGSRTVLSLSDVQLVSSPKASDKPLKSILKPTKSTPAQWTPAQKEALKDMIQCPHCGQPMSQGRSPLKDDPNIKLISIEQIDPLGVAIHGYPTPVSGNLITQKQLQSTSSATKFGYPVTPVKQLVQTSISGLPKPIPFRTSTGSTSTKCPNPKGRSIDFDFIQSAPRYVSSLPTIPDYPERHKCSQGSAGIIQSATGIIKVPTDPSSKTQPSSKPLPSTSTTSKVPVGIERSTGRLMTVSSLKSPQSQGPTVTSQIPSSSSSSSSSTTSSGTSSASRSSNDAVLTTGQTSTQNQGKPSVIRRDSSLLKGETYPSGVTDSPSTSSSNYTTSSTFPIGQTTPKADIMKSSSDNGTVDMTLLQQLLCDASRKEELRIQLNKATEEQHRALSTFTGCSPRVLCETLPILIPKLYLDDCDKMSEAHSGSEEVTNCINTTISDILDTGAAILAEALESKPEIVPEIIAKYLSDDEGNDDNGNGGNDNNGNDDNDNDGNINAEVVDF